MESGDSEDNDGVTVDDVMEIVTKVLENEENSNDIVDIIQYSKSHDHTVAMAAIQGICDIFCSWLNYHYDWCISSGVLPSSHIKGDSLSLQFNEWVQTKYLLTKKHLLESLKNTNIQECCLSGLMKLVKWEGLGYQQVTPGNPYHFPNCLFSQIIYNLLMGGENTSNLIGQFTEDFLTYNDIIYYVLQNMTSTVNIYLNKQRGGRHDDFSLTHNVYHLLQDVTMVMNQTLPGNFLSGDQTMMSEGQKQPHVCSIEKFRKVFNDCWLTFLHLPLPPAVHKEILTSLHSSVMPHMTKPRLLIDFLVGSYDQGGVNSILALNGLFILMHQYHLDYPDFYRNLYTLLRPSVFHVKYMTRFFRLLNVFLSSTHLPLYLVAAFAKRIARLSLTAPPQGAMIAAVLIMNLVRRHPNCRVLLHRNDPDVLQVEQDPYNPDEQDPVKCGALESCLWELKTLQNHYHPRVSSLMTRLLDPEKQKRQENLELYLNTSTTQLFESECKDLGEDVVPLNFVEPQGLWGPGFTNK